MTAAGLTPAVAPEPHHRLKTPDTYRPTHVERRLNRTSQNVDPAWDDSDVADYLLELDLADAARAEDQDW